VVPWDFDSGFCDFGGLVLYRDFGDLVGCNTQLGQRDFIARGTSTGILVVKALRCEYLHRGFRTSSNDIFPSKDVARGFDFSIQKSFGLGISPTAYRPFCWKNSHDSPFPPQCVRYLNRIESPILLHCLIELLGVFETLHVADVLPLSDVEFLSRESSSCPVVV